MAVYIKFKSAKDYETIPIDDHYISVGNLKQIIFDFKQLGRGKDFDLVLTNAHTNQEYTNESTMIPKSTAVLVRRVPGLPRKTIVATRKPEEEPKLENKLDGDQTVNNSSAMKLPEDTEWDDFGDDLYSIPETLPVQTSNQVQGTPLPSKAEEDSKMMASSDTPALDWQCQPIEGFGAGGGFGRNGRMMNNRNFVRTGFEPKTPPPGYICHRCKEPGHFIQHCPTNGDPDYDVKRVKPPRGIPKSMLMATPDGSYALPSGDTAVLKPNEAAFEKEMEGMPSARSVGEVPPELRCPLCKEVMKDAMLASKCCFNSFCDKCIRDYIISKSVCACGATNILADDLLPNKTLRDTINRILESNTSSSGNGGSVCQVQDMETRIPYAKIPSPTQSIASKGVQELPAPSHAEETSKMQETADEDKNISVLTQETEKEEMNKAAHVPEASNELICVKEPASQADKEVQQKPASAEAGKMKKKKKTRILLNAAEMQCRMAPDLANENYMISMGLTAYNPYWGMQPGIGSFIDPYAGGMPYNMGYGFGPMDVTFGGGFLPQDPFGGQSCVLPFVPPQRDLTDYGMGFNAGPPPMSREEFEASKADLKRRRKTERKYGGESRDLSRDRDIGREVGRSGDISSMKSKTKPIPPASSSDHHCQHLQQSKRPLSDHRSRDPELPRSSSKRKSDYDDDQYHHDYHHHHDDHRHHRDYYDDCYNKSGSKPAVGSKCTSDAEKKQNSTSIFSPEREASASASASASKKRKLSSSPVKSCVSHEGLSNGHYEHHQKASKKSVAAAAVDYESSDDDSDRHFKRRRSRYKASPCRMREGTFKASSFEKVERERDHHYNNHRYR